MDYTNNYHLTQWAMADRIQMEDFNADNQKIDAAIKAADQRAEALEKTVTEQGEQLTRLGNCGVYVGTYTGRGDNQPTVATVPGRPMFVYVQDGATALAIMACRGMTRAHTIMGADYSYSVVWSGRTVSWTNGSGNGYSFNAKDRPYFYVVLYAMDE